MATGGFTEREIKLLVAACQSFEGEPKVCTAILMQHRSSLTTSSQLNIEKFSQLSGLTVGSGRNAWAALKKKMVTQDATGTKTPTAKTPATKSGKKRPPPIVMPPGDGDSDDDEVSTPSKKPKTPKAKAKGKGKTKATKSDDEDKKEDDEDEDFVKVKNEVVEEEFEEV
ncbi:unnamed protein product [Aureobasidium mustum]|uniref:Uncharacterized protein n=1 Tax=Aureobasidium mustum TaxID=2773714 RepID=A0A9N8JUR9_9PEZI|nr:unnamed protein product [Aureobasidium mustum]